MKHTKDNVEHMFSNGLICDAIVRACRYLCCLSTWCIKIFVGFCSFKNERTPFSGINMESHLNKWNYFCQLHVNKRDIHILRRITTKTERQRERPTSFEKAIVICMHAISNFNGNLAMPFNGCSRHFLTITS